MRINIYLVLAAILFFPVLCGARGAGVYATDEPIGGLKPKIDSTLRTEGGQANFADSMEMSQEERNKRFYDTLAVRSKRNAFSRALYNALIVPSSSGPSRQNPMRLIDETERYRQFEGMTIASVEITTYNVFENPISYVEKGTNAVHMTTRRSAIRQDLLFKRGDSIDAETIVKNKQLLRSRSYIYDADIVVTPVPDVPGAVDVLVITHDSWTIGLDGGAKGLTGGIHGEIYDMNLFGMGNKFKYRLSLDWKYGKYEGSMFEYNIPNFFGTFWQADFMAGRSFWVNKYGGRINKKLLRDSDYELGFEFYDIRNRFYVPYIDDVSKRLYAYADYYYADAWLGKSFSLPKIESSIYGMARYYGVRYVSRTIDSPDGGTDPMNVASGLNPYFHNGNLYLGSLGIYREKFLTTNLIYGYGFSEYVATGYRAEITGGYLNGEFENGIYGGVSYKMGGFTRIGYFMGSASLGGYYDPASQKLFRSAMNLKLNYFTNLIRIGRNSNLRQFVTLNYVKGWGRDEGFDEWVRLTSESGPRNLRGISAWGRERAVMNTETVVFTPWQPLGFRVALFGFADFALIGNNRNILRNDFYTTIGLGIRMKNEMFVFGTIQITLTLGLAKPGGVLPIWDWFLMGDEQRMPPTRYTPDRPQVVDYK